MPKASGVVPEQAVLVALLKRCRAALCWGDADWEADVGSATEKDAALVADIDQCLGS